MPSHLCLAHYGPGLNDYQTGACIVRQAQEQTEPEYIRPGTASSKSPVTPAASNSTYDVRWSKPDMGTKVYLYKGLHLIQGGTARCLFALLNQASLITGSYDQPQGTSLRPCPLTLTRAPSTRS
jgi:hypothetical protein